MYNAYIYSHRGFIGDYCHSFGKNFSRANEDKNKQRTTTFTFPFAGANCVVENRVDGNIAEKVRVQSSATRS